MSKKIGNVRVTVDGKDWKIQDGNFNPIASGYFDEDGKTVIGHCDLMQEDLALLLVEALLNCEF